MRRSNAALFTMQWHTSAMQPLTSTIADPRELQRHHARRQFACDALKIADLQITRASNDASFRSYFRVYVGDQTWIVMDAPPDKENLEPFLDVAQRLQVARVRVPELFAHDSAQGFLLLEDFGSQLLLPALHAATVDHHYARAIEVANRMALSVDVAGLPIYDASRLGAEMDLLPEWFIQRHLGREMSPYDQRIFADARAKLIASALEQPQGFVHRDFHSRNLMLLPDGDLGVIDFQDALSGPITYDLVSLLKDCYIAWPPARVAAWCEFARVALLERGVAVGDQLAFARCFDWMGIQRHLKVLGIFARLNYRDGKSNYLADLPLVLDYTLSTAARYVELQPLSVWLSDCTQGRDVTIARA